MHTKQTSDLAAAAAAFSGANGANLSEKVESNSLLLVNWLAYLSSYHKTGVADCLLDAVASSIRETAGLLSLGLVRPALFSLRGQIDLLLGWLYFKDHSVEWLHVNQTGEGFKLKRELLQYLEQHTPRFAARYSTLREIRTRREPDPYRLLSAHIHAQSAPVLPTVGALPDLVQPVPACKECADVAFEVSEYLNDVLLSIYLSSWASLPPSLQIALAPRFKSADQKRDFFA
jgi:hypothetical protein